MIRKGPRKSHLGNCGSSRNQDANPTWSGEEAKHNTNRFTKQTSEVQLQGGSAAVFPAPVWLPCLPDPCSTSKKAGEQNCYIATFKNPSALARQHATISQHHWVVSVSCGCSGVQNRAETAKATTSWVPVGLFMITNGSSTCHKKRWLGSTTIQS